MDCALDDDQTIVVAMVDLVISEQFGLIYCNIVILFYSRIDSGNLTINVMNHAQCTLVTYMLVC